jgi:uncharacterized protein DUF1573
VKRRWRLGVVGFSALYAVAAMATGYYKQRPREQGPSRTFCEVPIYDFGTRSVGDVVCHQFLIRNASDAPISVKDVRPGCGCTVARASTDKIAPHGAICVDVEMDTRGMDGWQKQLVLVKWSDSAERPTVLAVQGTVVREAMQLGP